MTTRSRATHQTTPSRLSLHLRLKTSRVSKTETLTMSRQTTFFSLPWKNSPSLAKCTSKSNPVSIKTSLRLPRRLQNREPVSRLLKKPSQSSQRLGRQNRRAIRFKMANFRSSKTVEKRMANTKGPRRSQQNKATWTRKRKKRGKAWRVCSSSPPEEKTTEKAPSPWLQKSRKIARLTSQRTCGTTLKARWRTQLSTSCRASPIHRLLPSTA